MRIGRDRNREDGDLPLTPLIDVVFLLLIFFMVSTTFDRTRALDLELPVAATGTATPAQDATILHVWKNGAYHLNSSETDIAPDDLRAALTSQQPNRPLLIRAHPQAASQALLQALDAARQAGLGQVSMEVLPPSPAPIDFQP